jgi:hypothetical protein
VAACLAASLVPGVLAATGLLGRAAAGDARLLFTIVEWTAVCVAVFTVFCGFLHFRAKGEITAPIISLALFCAGVIDAFTIFYADGVFSASRVDPQLQAFSAALSRMFNAAVVMLGAAFFLISGRVLRGEDRARNVRTMLLAGLVFTAMIAGTVGFLARREIAPLALRASGLVARPWDVVALVMFVLCGALVLPTFYRWHTNIFSHALLVSMVPQVVSQLHAAFGAHDLYGAQAFAAGLAKVVAYGVPLAGLLLDYAATLGANVRSRDALQRRLLMEQQALEALRRDREFLNMALNHMQ